MACKSMYQPKPRSSWQERLCVTGFIDSEENAVLLEQVSELDSLGFASRSSQGAHRLVSFGIKPCRQILLQPLGVVIQSVGSAPEAVQRTSPPSKCVTLLP